VALTAASGHEYAAVRLFAERASALGLGFSINDENAAAVGSICRRLDGIPLAIELAVPRLKVLSVQQLARGLDERFRLLTGGSRTALPRQQTLHALIDWSYGLLSDAEKILLGRLSVFSGSGHAGVDQNSSCNRRNFTRAGRRSAVSLVEKSWCIPI
jgi:Predicted ATPase